MPEAQLQSAIDRLVAAGLLFRQGVAPNATYLFKHALVQDAAYGTLLRESRHALHARIAQTLEEQFVDVADSQPELLARHYTEAGLIERAAGFWGTAGQRSLARSALIEAAEQLSHAVSQIAALPATPARNREQIRLEVTIANVLMHVKGYAAPETRASLDRARSLIEHVEALGEPLDDPLMLFSVLYGLWVASYNAFNGDAVCELAGQFLTAAEKQGASVPIMVGRRLTGISLFHIGDLRLKEERILIMRCGFTIPPSIDLWRRDLVKISVWGFYICGRCRCGCLAIQTQRSQTPVKRSVRRARSV